MNELADLLRAAGEPPADDPSAAVIADAALRQFELFGISRSTMEQIARRAKVSRVTLYRRFPSKDALVDAVILRELQRFTADLDRAVEPFDDLDDRLVEGFLFVLDAIRGHRLLQRVLESEPETILPRLTVDGAPFLGIASGYLAARLVLDLDDDRTPDDLAIVADTVVRLLLSYLLTPQTLVDLDDPAAARAFALRYLRPILVG
ncbi:MAG: TetR family transcriptional regulator [Baekduiaceae bacterium]